jgi:polyhydroxybutyrate depolymerase
MRDVLRMGWLVLLALTGIAVSAAAPPRSTRHEIQAGGLSRSYRLHAPPSLDKSRPAPLVLVFHGGRGDGESVERLTGFDALADREGFLVAYPDGFGKQWNDGRDVADFETYRKGVDDVAFVSALIDAIAKEHAVDPRRVFATGISNGGIFSHYLGARLSTRIAAIAPVAGGVAEPFRARFEPERPVSVLILNGTEDPLVPYGGGNVGGTHGRVLSTEDAVRLWTAADGCAAPPKIEILPDTDPADACRATRSTWTGGRDGAEVVLYTFEGGGHTWPGGPQYLPKLVIGRVCRDVDATRIIWDFFKAHPGSDRRP